MPLDMFFDYMAVSLNRPRAAGKKATIVMDFTDTKEKYVLTLDNSVFELLEEDGQECGLHRHVDADHPG